ncbi:MAG: hypothetical protein NWF13_03130, partial [Candidatus Bathyarchaeota archaeon]|nr:hypothetical protein [Candidatus Bathyarchaeota archaeon]
MPSGEGVIEVQPATDELSPLEENPKTNDHQYNVEQEKWDDRCSKKLGKNIGASDEETTKAKYNYCKNHNFNNRQNPKVSN